MATIDDLPIPFFYRPGAAMDRSAHERFELVRELRGLRRTPTAKPAKSRAKKTKPRSSKTLDKQLANLNPAQAAALMELLENGD